MKEIILRVPDEMVAPIKELASHMPEVEIVTSKDDVETGDGLGDIDRRVALALRVIQKNGVLRYPYDFTWIMAAIGNGKVEGLGGFRSPQSFMNYLRGIGVENVPSRSTLSAWNSRVTGRYPDWVFSDTNDPTEILRRKNVFRQFLSALLMAKRRESDNQLDKLG